MKLLFVKFLTSRENEIEKKEEEEKEHRHYLLCRHPARPRPKLPPRSCSLFLPSLPSSSPSTQLHQPAPVAPSLPAATCRKSNALQLSLPSCSPSPFFLHKITETAERGGKDRGGAPTLPTQLSYPTITRRAPARPQARVLPVADSPSTISAFSCLKVRFIHIERSHRKTKTENKLSCFITFIDE